MIATRKSTLRAAVIGLLRQSGKSPIEAVDLWDRVYSRQLDQAAPGTHKFIIGGATLEFTKPGKPENETVISATDPGNSDFPLGIVALVVIAALVIVSLGVSLIF